VFVCRQVRLLISALLVLQLVGANLAYAGGLCALGAKCLTESVPRVNTQAIVSVRQHVKNSNAVSLDCGVAEHEGCDEGVLCERCGDYTAAHLSALTVSMHLPDWESADTTRGHFLLALADYIGTLDPPTP
jgi:hypothetical protein